MAKFILVDTSVISRLTKKSRDATAYNSWRGNAKLAVNDQVRGELLSAGYTGQRLRRLRDLLDACLKLPTSESTHVAYARVATIRAELRRLHHPGEGAQDNDVWIVASAMEYEVPLFSHDAQQVQLGRLAGVKVMTNLNDLRDMNPDLTEEPEDEPQS